MRSSPQVSSSWLAVAASILICCGVWRWATAILVPFNTAKAVESHRPIGNNSDLYARWLGAREVLLHGRDPYSAEMTREIQTGFYGRPLDPANPSDPKAEESFVYPLYVVFLLSPTVNLPFPAVAELFRWILLLCIALSVPLWVRGVGIPAERWAVICVMFLAVGSYPAIEEYSQQNLTALVVMFLAGAVAAVAENRLILSGFLLALATAKPDVTAGAVLWLLWWALASGHRRRLLWSFIGSMAALVAGAQAVSPGWIGRFFAALRRYPTYGTDPSLLQVLLGSLLAKLALAVIGALVLAICWQRRKVSANSARFGHTLALVSAATLICIPKLAAYNQLLLIPALLVLWRDRKLAGGTFAKAFSKAAFACLIWQWGAATALSLVALFIAPQRLTGLAQLPLYTWLALPPLTFLAILAVSNVPESESIPLLRNLDAPRG